LLADTHLEPGWRALARALQPLTDTILLNAWETGRARHPVDRALLLLALVLPDVPLEMLTALSIGQRDSLLMTLYERRYGPQLNARIDCPHCGAALELTLAIPDLRVEPDITPAPPYSLQVGEIMLRFRLPDSRDLAAIAAFNEVSAARAHLIRRCVLDARQADCLLTADDLPPGVIDELAARLADLDPQADLSLALDCPACGHRWVALLDIGTFLWARVQQDARRLLLDVHTLARAYGWREADILAMSDARRRTYLEWVT
jgi:hypothetical protein